MGHKRPFSHKQLVADVSALPDGPEKSEMLAHLEGVKEIGKLIGKTRKLIKEREEAERGSG